MSKWHFCNQTTKEQKSKLSESDAIEWIKTLDSSQVESWYCWQVGYQSWVPIKMDSTWGVYLKEEVPSRPQLIKLEEKIDEKRDQRRCPRVNIRLRAVLTNKKNSFISFTKNVSLNGILLETEIPRHIFNGKCEIYLTGPNLNESIMFQCIPVGSDTNPKRLQLTEVAPKHQAILERWLAELQSFRQKAK